MGTPPCGLAPRHIEFVEAPDAPPRRTAQFHRVGAFAPLVDAATPEHDDARISLEGTFVSKLVERFSASSGDKLVVTVIVIYDAREGATVIRHMATERGKPCTPLDADSWRIDSTNVIVRRVKS